MRSFLSIALVVLGLFVNSCSKSGLLKEGTIELGVHKCIKGRISGDNLNLCFDELISDSRCPINAMCIWQGTAVAKFSLKKNNETTTFELATINMSPNYRKDTIIMGYQIEFVDLLPYPGTYTPPAPDDQIKAKLKITRL